MTTKKRNWRTTSIGIVLLIVLLLVFEIKYWSMLSFMMRLKNPQAKNSREKQISCDSSHNAYNICTIHVATVMDPTSSKFFIQRPTIILDPNPIKIRPYPRKFDIIAMSKIKELTIIKSGEPIPSCHVTHNSPALVFSAGGYTGNFFHDFNDGFIPLFITLNSIFHEDVVLVISNARDWWLQRYSHLLDKFSKYPIIDLDNYDDNNNNSSSITHCFPYATIGLVSHGFMTINPKLMPNSMSLHHFHEFLNKAYYGASNVKFSTYNNNSRPRLVLVNRSSGEGRLLLNLEELKLEITKEGFDMVVFEPKSSTPLIKAFEVIGSCNVMVGVHGAALTHSLFLRPGSLFIQVVPLGAEWVSEVCFGIPATAMGLNYMEYRIGAEESSLIEKYDKENMMIKDPVGFLNGKPWSKSTMDVYLKEQNVRLDLVRFRKHLKKAYMKAKQLVINKGEGSGSL